jgi:hypothetical protein
MTTIRIYHTDKTPWTEMCTWCLENVGLPNTDTWQFRTADGHMDFEFATEQNAIWFSLLWSDTV